jgi:hypothetical protein
MKVILKVTNPRNDGLAAKIRSSMLMLMLQLLMMGKQKSSKKRLSLDQLRKSIGLHQHIIMSRL